MSSIKTPTLLVIIGISGDLAHRKLLPAIREIAKADMLPDAFKIVGVSRKGLKNDDVLPMGGENDYLRQVLELYEMDPSDPSAYAGFADYLVSTEKKMGLTAGQAQRLFYLAVPPTVSKDIVENLGTSGLAKAPNTKLLLEKPFGTNLETAHELIDHIHSYFEEESVYRIDHYLAKEMTQNLVIFRSGNSLFRRTWNSDFIESISISMTEQIGIEGRAAFYEQTGALRDIVQSHLLQLAALTLMDLPEDEDWSQIPEKRHQALLSLVPPKDISQSVVRGQYRSYRKEVDDESSTVETFVSLQLESSDKKWKGVPITLTTGKGLNEVSTEIRIAYKKDKDGESNMLILRIQPNEGVEIRLWAHQPGYDHSLRQLPLKFSYSDYYAGLPEAYERVFVDAMRGNRSLFTSSEEVIASWRLLDPILKSWAKSSARDLVFYESRSSVDDVLGSEKR